MNSTAEAMATTAANASLMSVVHNMTAVTVSNASAHFGQSDVSDQTIGHFQHLHLTNGFVIRTLSLFLVISMVLTIICTIRALYRRRNKWRVKSNARYDTLPTAAINDSLPKNAFVLNDSDEEEETLFDSSHRLIK